MMSTVMSSFNSPLKKKKRLHCCQSSTPSSKKENNSNLCYLHDGKTFFYDITIGKCQMLCTELKALRTKNGINMLCNIIF